MNEKQLAKLIRKNAEKVNKPTRPRSNLPGDPSSKTRQEIDADEERTAFFKEMKRREF
jgi:hypothetical protein